MTRLVYVKHKIIKNAKFKYQVCKQYKMKKRNLAYIFEVIILIKLDL